MKIVCFNVNGLRAILNKDFEATFKALDADVFFLEETKLSEDPGLLPPFDPDGYQSYWTVSKVRKGYSGVAVFTRIDPLSVHYGLLDGKYDDEGRVITLEFEDFYFVGAYVPNAGDGLKRLDFRLQYEKDLVEYFAHLSKKKPIVYGGDLNVAHKPIDLKNPKANEMNPGYTIVPVRLFLNEKGLAKLVIALAKGKKEYDKRQTLKEKDDKREMARVFKH